MHLDISKFSITKYPFLLLSDDILSIFLGQAFTQSSHPLHNSLEIVMLATITPFFHFVFYFNNQKPTVAVGSYSYSFVKYLWQFALAQPLSEITKSKSAAFAETRPKA